MNSRIRTPFYEFMTIGNWKYLTNFIASTYIVTNLWQLQGKQHSSERSLLLFSFVVNGLQKKMCLCKLVYYTHDGWTFSDKFVHCELQCLQENEMIVVHW